MGGFVGEVSPPPAPLAGRAIAGAARSGQEAIVQRGAAPVSAPASLRAALRETSITASLLVN